MQLKAGTFYLDRLNRVCGPVSPLPEARQFGPYRWCGPDGLGLFETYTDEGRVMDRVSFPEGRTGDLIAEAEAPAFRLVPSE